MTDFHKSDAIYQKYMAHYKGEIQGCCLLIADEIQQTIGGDIIAGALTWYGGSCRRTHWWVEKDSQIIDPMGDAFLAHEESPGRSEAHRNRSEFEAILPLYERWRIA